jgi:aconitate hydratase
MIKIINNGIYLIKDDKIIEETNKNELNNALNNLIKENKNLNISDISPQNTKINSIAYQILKNHNISNDINNLKIKFDALASHDITYVGIIQTARACGLKEFPVPYVLTNCHNSLCAIGGTINEDDHLFGLSAAQKYGGIYVPAHQAVIHQFNREMLAGCGKMILGSDSHTRYGALGTMGIGEGGPEIVKQLLKGTYDINFPEIIAVYLEGIPKKGVGPQDIALTIIKEVFANGFVKNKILEFVGPGIKNLTIDYRNSIDVMTTEATCLSSIWITDEEVLNFYKTHKRPDNFKELKPGVITYYNGLIKIDMSKIEPMIALPFHPSNVYSIKELNENAQDILAKVDKDSKNIIENPELSLKLSSKIKNGRITVDQGVVAGCAGGTFENIMAMVQIMENKTIGSNEFSLSIYPSSQPVYIELVKNSTISKLMETGAIIRSAFCGPCFGAGDVPANEGFSVRHTTRNFPHREGSKPGQHQISSVALMDARSVAATAINNGILTPANQINFDSKTVKYNFDDKIYKNRVYWGFSKPKKEKNLIFGPNIVDWPEMLPLSDNLLLKIVSKINDPVTTTDELIPSGEISSFRSNPIKLASFTLSRKDPEYVERAKLIQQVELERYKMIKNKKYDQIKLNEITEMIKSADPNIDLKSMNIGSVIVVKKPGDGSAREQAASCQKVLGGWANIAIDYATKRYRSNVINWGMLPFIINPDDFKELQINDYILIKNIKSDLESGKDKLEAKIINKNKIINVFLPNLSEDDRRIILAGSLINDSKSKLS